MTLATFWAYGSESLSTDLSGHPAGASMTVGQRFIGLLSNLTLTDSQREDGIAKHTGVRQSLNWYYYNQWSGCNNSFLVGSWGKSTQIRPPRDIDIMFVLPEEVYQKYEKASGNKQSQLLQEVKRILSASYPNTDLRADGQVVVVPFVSYSVEVVPAFHFLYGAYRICDTKDGGSYKYVNPEAECRNVQTSNDETHGNTRDLIRMLKRWQEHCNVPMKSFWLELLAVDFLRTWPHKGNSATYYDYLMRDFFTWLTELGKWSYSTVSVPGASETISLGNDWASRAESARDRATKATEYESKDYRSLAGEEWQKIFGQFVPIE